jgi:hypothetical protein
VKAIDMDKEWGPWAAIVWLIACGLTLLHRRFWLAFAALALPAAWYGESAMSSGHAVLIGWLALILGSTTGDDTRVLLLFQALSVYLFGALNKLNAHYFSGATIDTRNVPSPEAVFAVAGLILELGLVVLVWSRSRWALPIAVLLHAGVIAFLGTVSLYQLTMLSSFNLLMVVLVWAGTRRAPDRDAAHGAEVAA